MNSSEIDAPRVSDSQTPEGDDPGVTLASGRWYDFYAFADPELGFWHLTFVDDGARFWVSAPPKFPAWVTAIGVGVCLLTVAIFAFKVDLLIALVGLALAGIATAAVMAWLELRKRPRKRPNDRGAV
jgi:hypothetical protein